MSNAMQESFPYLETIFELLTDKVESHRVDARVEGGHIDADVVNHKKEACNVDRDNRGKGGGGDRKLAKLH